MFPSGSKRRKKSREFEILVVPRGDGGGTRSIGAGVAKLALWGGAVIVVLFLVFFLAFRFTPLGRLVGVKPPSDSTENETERRIRSLATELAVLKDYNETLRKALGERVEKRDQESVQRENDEPKQKTESSDEQIQSPPPTPAIVTRSGFAETEHLPVLSAEGSLPLFVPTTGVVTQGFEPERNHFGIDYATREGTPVFAAAKGYVIFSGWTYDDGNVVIVSHVGGIVTLYKHQQSLMKSIGSQAARGEMIGLVGNTGRTSKGPHLHFEVLRDGVPQDPIRFLLSAKIAS